MCFSRTYRHLLTFLIVSSAFPFFLSCHKTFSILLSVVDSRHSVLEGWCAGHNPPFVQRRHSAKRATRASRRQLPGVYLPFHLAGQPFHRIQPNILNTLNVHHRPSAELDVSFLRCCQGSHPTPYASVAMSAWWAEFPHALKSATAVRQLTNPKYVEG